MGSAESRVAENTTIKEEPISKRVTISTMSLKNKEETKRLIIEAVVEKVKNLAFQTPEEELLSLVVDVITEEAKRVSSSKGDQQEMKRIVKEEIFNDIEMVYPTDPTIGLYRGQYSWRDYQ